MSDVVIAKNYLSEEELKVLNNLSSDHIQSGSYILVPVTSVL